ncbi:WhiB family transcriptional regulator [Embleya scabrispora]|uniref:WhiB family transcriptional regulator n=1 Tax=Embleya scabrispora TaxID=159449 RepID=UPI00037C7D19|nr:WhiB family transcriptional regulator [Streptomyces sp. SID5474]
MTERIEIVRGVRTATWTPPVAGACATADRQLFLGYPGEPVVARLAREEDAKRVCARCSVLLECRASALAETTPVGVRGGLTANERGAVRRRRAHH